MSDCGGKCGMICPTGQPQPDKPTADIYQCSTTSNPQGRLLAGPGFSTYLHSPTGLAVNPNNANELWVTNRDSDSISVIELDKPQVDSSYWTESKGFWLQDAFNEHFLDAPMDIAFCEEQNNMNKFATIGDSENCVQGMNFISSPERNTNFKCNNFTGPSLWDSTTYAKIRQTKTFKGDWLAPGSGRDTESNPLPDCTAEVKDNQVCFSEGSHNDMLHSSPLAMGMVWYRRNQYFVFDGQGHGDGGPGHPVLYDFNWDHREGNTFHADGRTLRYIDVPLQRVAGVLSGMTFQPKHSTVLYIANTGAGTVLRMNVETGKPYRWLSSYYSFLANKEGFVGTGAIVTFGDTSTADYTVFRSSTADPTADPTASNGWPGFRGPSKSRGATSTALANPQPATEKFWGGVPVAQCANWTKADSNNGLMHDVKPNGALQLSPNAAASLPGVAGQAERGNLTLTTMESGGHTGGHHYHSMFADTLAKQWKDITDDEPGPGSSNLLCWLEKNSREHSDTWAALEQAGRDANPSFDGSFIPPMEPLVDYGAIVGAERQVLNLPFNNSLGHNKDPMPSGLLWHSGGYLVVVDHANSLIYAFEEQDSNTNNTWVMKDVIDTKEPAYSIMGATEAPTGGGILYTDTTRHQVYAVKFCNL